MGDTSAHPVKGALPADARRLAGRFVLQGQVGQGGMAVVHRALDEQSGQIVAVKLLHADTTTPYILEHFVREAEILATIQHPHIVSYVAHGYDEAGRAFLAMEWLDGYDLALRLQRGPLSLREAIALVGAVASALQSTHSQQVVHRDTTRKNKICSPSGDTATHRRRTDHAHSLVTHSPH